MCVLENVGGLAHQLNRRIAMSDHFLSILRRRVPQFHWSICKLHAQDYKLPQMRVRLFLRGIRTTLAHSVPDPVPALGPGRLKDFLGKLGPMSRDSLTPPQQNNLLAYERILKDHRLHVSRFVCDSLF